MTTEEYRKTYAVYGVSYADHCIQAGLDMSPQGFRDYVEGRKRLEGSLSSPLRPPLSQGAPSAEDV
jgi:hypothetical protein